jgi:adenylyltransferase/sulfurtransferase
MPVKVIIPTPLRQYTGKKDSIEVEAKTVAEALSSLTAQYGDLRRHLYNDEGKLRSFVNIYLNDEDIRYLQKEATPLNSNDVISIVPSIAGGKMSVVSGHWWENLSRPRDRGQLTTDH